MRDYFPIVARFSPQLANNTTKSTNYYHSGFCPEVQFNVSVGGLDTTVTLTVQAASDSSGTGATNITALSSVLDFAGTEDDHDKIVIVKASDCPAGKPYVRLSAVIGNGGSGSHISCTGIALDTRFVPDDDHEQDSSIEVLRT